MICQQFWFFWVTDTYTPPGCFDIVLQVSTLQTLQCLTFLLT
jgi:hypothetical protein